MPARTLYAVVFAAGIPAGIIATIIPWGRYITRPLLFSVWPIACTAAFFSSLGTFDFSKAAYVDLLNYEFAFVWGGAAYAVIVFWPRKKKVFEEAARKHSGWQARASEAPDNKEPHEIFAGKVSDSTRALFPDENGDGWITIEEAIKDSWEANRDSFVEE